MSWKNILKYKVDCSSCGRSVDRKKTIDVDDTPKYNRIYSTHKKPLKRECLPCFKKTMAKKNRKNY